MTYLIDEFRKTLPRFREAAKEAENEEKRGEGGRREEGGGERG